MKTLLLLSFIVVVRPFNIVAKKWVGKGSADSIDFLTKQDSKLFIVRGKKLEWFNPNEKNKPFNQRIIPRHIQRVCVSENSLMITISSENSQVVSETTLYSNGRKGTISWNDITMYENIVENNNGGNILRVNYHGDISYGKPWNLNTRRLMSYNNKTYTAVSSDNKYLWCALEQNTKQGKATRIDCYNIETLKLKCSFYMKSTHCSQPDKISVIERDCFPDQIIHFIISYKKGGMCVGHTNFPPEKLMCTIDSKHIPSLYYIKSIAVDFPYIYTLDDHGVEVYKYPATISNPQYLGRHKMYFSPFQITTQIVAMKRQVFWNGQEVLHSLEVQDS